MGYINGVIQSRGLQHLCICGQTVIHTHFLQVDGIKLHRVQFGLLTFNRPAWGLGHPILVSHVLLPSHVFKVSGCIPGVQYHRPIIHRSPHKGSNGIAMRFKQGHVAYRGAMRNFYLDVWKYMPALKLAQRRTFECNWTLQASDVWKHTFLPSSLIKAQHNARYDISVFRKMTDLPCITAPVCSWEEPVRTPTPPRERGTRDRWSERSEMAVDPGKVAGGSRNLAQ